MPYCCVPQCKSSTQCRRPGISFHEIPVDSSLRERWLEAIPRENWMPTLTSNCSVVCSLHFRECDFRESCKTRRRLKPGAVPSLFSERFSREPDAGCAIAEKRKRDSSPTGALGCMLLSESKVLCSQPHDEQSAEPNFNEDPSGTATEFCPIAVPGCSLELVQRNQERPAMSYFLFGVAASKGTLNEDSAPDRGPGCTIPIGSLPSGGLQVNSENNGAHFSEPAAGEDNDAQTEDQSALTDSVKLASKKKRQPTKALRSFKTQTKWSSSCTIPIGSLPSGGLQVNSENNGAHFSEPAAGEDNDAQTEDQSALTDSVKLASKKKRQPTKALRSFKTQTKWSSNTSSMFVERERWRRKERALRAEKDKLRRTVDAYKRELQKLKEECYVSAFLEVVADAEEGTAKAVLLLDQAGHSCDFEFASVGPTVEFMEAFHKWFTCMDVSNLQQHIHRNDEDARQFSEIDDQRLHWLEDEFLSYIDQLKTKSRAENFLSKETHHALVFATMSNVESIRFLLSHKKFKFVLTRKFSSDSKEAMFGFLRRSSGCNDALDVKSAVCGIEKMLKTGIVASSAQSNEI
ncbi:uncharacterized protein LOC142566205 [Dermacentor variabilis]|uniref:uncharacterized protein LOC142566205 n=1 Tax=Dermacentor variabilis TaxID=34621 RepID=UPI003F5CA91B